MPNGKLASAPRRTRLTPTTTRSQLEMPMHPVVDGAKSGVKSKSMIGAMPRLQAERPSLSDPP